MSKIKTPYLTVDAIIELSDYDNKIVLIERKNPPYGLALPGGFVDYGESVEDAVRREAKEEVTLDFKIKGLVGVWSDPSRDKRMHTTAVVFCGQAHGYPAADDDAESIVLFDPEHEEIPEMAFDHRDILSWYLDRHKH
jgi:ADP-ribose pyrophosphatase YjhB (NUDIX family)